MSGSLVRARFGSSKYFFSFSSGDVVAKKIKFAATPARFEVASHTQTQTHTHTLNLRAPRSIWIPSLPPLITYTH